MTEVGGVPALIDSLFVQISQNFEKAEAADVIQKLKRLYPTKKDSYDSPDLYGALKQLYILGAIDDEGNQKLLELLAKKASKKDQILDLISRYKEASSPPKDVFVGRDHDVEHIIKLVTNPKPRVPGVNLFGDSGVGKTTLVKEVAKRLESFDNVFIDLREIKCLNTVYFNILQALHLPSWDDNKKERIYNHLASLNRKTVIILDSIEQLLSRENQEEQETRADFLEFLKVIICTETSTKGYLKVILTSTIQLNEAALKSKLFTEYDVKPFSKDVSKYFISKRIRGDHFSEDVQQDKTMYEIAQLCRDNPYLLQGAQQLMRESFATPIDVLGKITAQVRNKVPEEFACISALFESLPSDHLRQVAVKISLLRRPFSVSTAMKITEISSDYDAELDLEMLAIHKIITAEDVNGKRKYDMHALFRDFVNSHLCKENPVYKEQLRKGEKLFFEHFSGKLTKLANILESEFVNTYCKLEGNRANFELAIQLSEENKETFKLLLHTDDHNQFALMGILFEVLKDEKERRELFGRWAKAAEKQGQWFACALMRCWQSIQGSDLEGTLNEEILEKAKTSIQNLQPTSPEKLNEVSSLFLHCQGKIKWMKAKKLTPEQKRREHGKKLLEEGIEHFKRSVELRKQLNGDSTLTARALNLIGNCYMDLKDPLAAKVYYQQAMDMKIRLVGSEKHWEIPTYYNQMAEVHEMLGRKQEEKWYKRLVGLKGTAKKEYEKAVKLMEKALSLQEELGVSDTLHTAIFQRNLANILIGLGEYDKALEYAQKSFEIRNANLGKHPETVRSLYMIGIIHEWRNDLEAALQSYEEAFAMEESLPVDNHSVVRKLLCGRLEAMCKQLKKKDKLKKYEPIIKAIMQIKSSQSTKEPAVQYLHATGKLEIAGEPATEEEVPGHPIQDGIPEETPVGYTGAGAQQGDLPDVPLPPDDSPVTPTEPGTADTEHPVQSSPPNIPIPPDDIPVTPTEPGTADTEHPIQEDLPEVPLPPDDIPVTPTEPGTDPVQEDLPDIPLPPDDIPVTPTEPGTADTELPVQEDLPDVPLPPDDIPVTPTEPGTADTELPVQEDLPDVQLPPDDIPVTPTYTEPGTADTEHPVQEDLAIQAVTGIMDEIPPRHFTINPGGGTLDIPRIGIRLDILPHTVEEATTVMYQSYTTETLPGTSPARKGETVVSYIVGLEPSTTQLNEPIFVSMMHSGPGKGCGYETIVKAYNQGSETWEEPEVLDRRQESMLAHGRRDYVRVQISKLTMLAVVTRLITDRFQVTPKGCVVRSSVCHDVIVEFPEGAVDKTVEGTMKLLPMPNNIYNLYNVYACPILSVKGFENVELLKTVTIQMLHPCPTRFSADQVTLVRYKNDKWQAVKDPKIEVRDTYIMFQIKHFCWLWLMIPVGGTVAVASAYKMFEYLSAPPQSAFIAALRDLEQPALQMNLHCLPNHKQKEVFEADKDVKKDIKMLAASTVDELRPGETACTKIEGCFETNEDIYLKFLKNQEPFSRVLNLRRKQENTGTKEQFVRLVFHKKENKDPPLCEFSIPKDMLYNVNNSKTYGKRKGASMIEVESSDDEDEDKARFVRPTNLDEIPLHDRPHRTDNVYKMTSYPRGVAVIINIEHYNVGPDHPMYGKLKNRVGSKKDEEDVNNLFNDLYFTVETINSENKTSASELVKELHRISTEFDFSAYDCFVLFIMSHGSEGTIFASDGKEILIRYIVYLFWNSTCKSLAGKPKLFFFQACRGDDEDHGVTFTDAPEDIRSSIATNYYIPSTSEPATNEVSQTADILEFYSCFIGFEAFRNSKTGSPFVQNIVKVFRKYSYRHHTLELITMVNNKVSKGKYLNKKQMPQFHSSLTKRLYFWPGHFCAKYS